MQWDYGPVWVCPAHPTPTTPTHLPYPPCYDAPAPPTCPTSTFTPFHSRTGTHTCPRTQHTPHIPTRPTYLTRPTSAYIPTPLPFRTCCPTHLPRTVLRRQRRPAPPFATAAFRRFPPCARTTPTAPNVPAGIPAPCHRAPVWTVGQAACLTTRLPVPYQLPPWAVSSSVVVRRQWRRMLRMLAYRSWHVGHS